MRLTKHDWRMNALYKKWELYLYRLFKLGGFIQSELNFTRINAPEPEDYLDKTGYNGITRIPPNPFIDRDEEIFLMFYEHLVNMNFKENEKGMGNLFKEIWFRIEEIKSFLGITIGTRYIGEPDEEKRLCNEIYWYTQYPEAGSQLYRLVFGDVDKNKIDLIAFRRFLKDRRPVNNIWKTIQIYYPKFKK